MLQSDASQTPTISEELSSDSDDEVDIDALLRAAEAALAKNRPKAVKPPGKAEKVRAALINKQDGVHKLNPDVLLAQNTKQATAMADEKVSNALDCVACESSNEMMTTVYCSKFHESVLVSACSANHIFVIVTLIIVSSCDSHVLPMIY